MFVLGFIVEVFKGQSNANTKENKQRNYYHSQIHIVEHTVEHDHDQDYTHVREHQTRQIRYTSDQLYKIGKTFYITKFNCTTVNTIKSLGIR